MEKAVCQAHTAVLPLDCGTEKKEGEKATACFLMEANNFRSTLVLDCPTHNSTGLQKSAQLFSHQFLFQLATDARMAENTATEPHGHKENECVFREQTNDLRVQFTYSTRTLCCRAIRKSVGESLDYIFQEEVQNSVFGGMEPILTSTKTVYPIECRTCW